MGRAGVRSGPLLVVRAAARVVSVAERLAARSGLAPSAPLAARELLGGLAGTWLDADERASLGRDLYDAARERARAHVPDWERQWLAETLPPPPARILVGGAGTGREAVALLRSGYRVDALEPAPESAGACRRALGAPAVVAAVTYEQLAAAVLDGAHGLASELARERYDAVLLGWTSYMHLVTPEVRARVLLALDALCPSGPILITFRPADRARRRGTAHRVGRALGATLGCARRHPPSPAGAEERFGVACGFLVGITVADLAREAAACGRVVRMDGEDDGTVRASLWPGGRPGSARGRSSPAPARGGRRR